MTALVPQGDGSTEGMLREAALTALGLFDPHPGLRIAWLQELCRRGHGSWIAPAAGRGGQPAARPATHLHEVSLYGATGRGATEAEAARSWILAASRLARGEAA